jgi:hypothetical protein
VKGPPIELEPRLAERDRLREMLDIINKKR